MSAIEPTRETDFLSAARPEYAFDTSFLAGLDLFLDDDSTNEVGDEVH